MTMQVPPDRDEMMRAQPTAFVSASVNRSSGQLATLQEGIFAIALCDAARISSVTGRTEPIRE